MRGLPRGPCLIRGSGSTPAELPDGLRCGAGQRLDPVAGHVLLNAAFQAQAGVRGLQVAAAQPVGVRVAPDGGLHPSIRGGAKGIRTPDLLIAKVPQACSSQGETPPDKGKLNKRCKPTTPRGRPDGARWCTTSAAPVWALNRARTGSGTSHGSRGLSLNQFRQEGVGRRGRFVDSDDP